MIRRLELIFVFCLLLTAQMMGQTNMEVFTGLFDVPAPTQAHYVLKKNNANEFQVVMNLLFVGYKRYVSTQDANSCQFYPSCSQYAWQAVQKKGIVIGMMMGFDRLTRCNGMNEDHYQVYKNSNDLLFDPVK